MKEQTQEDLADKRYHRALFLWAALGVAVMVSAFWLVAIPRATLDDSQVIALQKAGLRGDAFGLLNTIFSGLAFAGVLIALELQRRDVLEQRRENKASRDEAERHTEATDRMRVANLLGVMAQINATLGRSKECSPEQVVELRKILERTRKELDWEPAPASEVAAEQKARSSWSVH
jgi:hypothetical protein